MIDDSYLEMKVNFGRFNLEFNKPLEKFEFNELSDLISYYPITMELIEKSDDNDNQKTIVSLSGYFYDMDYIYKYGLSLFDTFDMCSGDTNKLYDILFDGEEKIKIDYQTFSDNIFYLDRIYVEKDYRNKGYAKLLLKQLEDLIKYVFKLNVGIIVVCAQPFEKNGVEEKMIRDDKTLKRKLIELYKNVGFKEINNNYDYLVKVIDD